MKSLFCTLTASPVLPSLAVNTIYLKIWQGLSNMEKDPHMEVSTMAKKLTDYARTKVYNSGKYKTYGIQIFKSEY